MATIIKTKSGYRAQVCINKIRDSGSFRTKREAEAWASSRETELRSQENALPGERHTVAQTFEKYVAEVSSKKRGERWERIRIAALLRDPLLCAELPVAKLTTNHLSDWRDTRLKQVSAGTVIREIGLLSDALEVARREWKWITVNPIKDMRKPSSPDSRRIIITRAQIRLMLATMGRSPRQPVRSVSQSVAVCFLLALRTGMRAGELTGLTWDRVHDGYCRLLVTKTVPRNVPLTMKAMRLIESMRGFDNELVFGLQAQTLDALFRKYRKRAGLEGFTFHDSRHTAATWIAQKISVLDLCKAFGWSDPKMAMVYYNPSAADIAKRMN